jgi:hypothetical protein
MRIYTSEISQFGRTLDILGKEVTFDRVGCAEVADEDGKQIVKYAPDWYSKEKKEAKVEVKPASEDMLLKDATIEELQEKVAKLKLMDESRVSTIKAAELENSQIRSEMERIVKEKQDFETEATKKEDAWTKEKEQLDYKFELALLEIPDIQEMCTKLSLDTKDCIKKGKKDAEPTVDKKALIELITNAAE